MEGYIESAFQAILATVYLLKIGTINYNVNENIVAIFSLITSLYSLISRIIFQYSSLLIPKARESNIEMDDMLHLVSCYICTCVLLRKKEKLKLDSTSSASVHRYFYNKVYK